MAKNRPAGRIAKKFGMGGELIVNLYDSFPEEFDIEEPLMVVIDSLAVPLFCDSFTRRGAGSAVVRFADFDTVGRADELVGREFSLRTVNADNEQADSEEIYLDDFVGYDARFKGSKKRGHISDFVDNELNPLFVVDVEGSEVIIPAVDQMIDSYSVGRREVVFDIPEGLFNLNG